MRDVDERNGVLARAAALSRTGRVWVSQTELAQARTTSPERLLVSRYPQVRRERSGRTLVVPDVLRADLREGRWVACDWSGGGIGDTVALARFVLGCSFVDAVRALIGVHQVSPSSLSRGADVPYALRPRVPSPADPGVGRAYLIGRGITEAVIRGAEACGALIYLRDGVLFLGLSRSAEVRAATVRYFVPRPMPDGTKLTKRDLKGSDKAYPVVLAGDPERLVVVEGAVSGLASQSLAEIKGRTRPAVIVTGGINPLRWICEADNKASSLLALARIVMILGENEVGADGARDPAKQARTDAARHKLADAISAVRRGLRPDLVYPPANCKDAAEWLVRSREHSAARPAGIG